MNSDNTGLPVTLNYNDTDMAYGLVGVDRASQADTELA